MSTWIKSTDVLEPVSVRVSRETLSVELCDGRTILAPLQWFPRLLHGTPAERANYQLGYDFIHWPDLNEDISVEGLLRGDKSGESPRSLKRWLTYRAKGEKEPIPTLPIPREIGKELEKIWVDKKQKSRSRRAG